MADVTKKTVDAQPGRTGAITDEDIKKLYKVFQDYSKGKQVLNQRIKSADQVLHVGDEVDVKVIGIKDGKISLSIKALAEDAEKEQEEELEHVEIPKAEAIGTSLGDLFKNIKL